MMLRGLPLNAYRSSRPRHALALAVLLACAALPACATNSAVATGETLDVEVRIDNDLPGTTRVTAYLLSDAGMRRSLGPIESGDDASYERTVRPGVYQLVAMRVGDSDVVSDRFRLDSDRVLVTWTLAQNQLTVTRR